MPAKISDNLVGNYYLTSNDAPRVYGKLVGATAFLIYCYLKSRANSETGRTFPGFRKITEETGLSSSTISRGIDALVEHDLLEVWKTFGKVNHYVVKNPEPLSKSKQSAFNSEAVPLSNSKRNKTQLTRLIEQDSPSFSEENSGSADADIPLESVPIKANRKEHSAPGNTKHKDMMACISELWGRKPVGKEWGAWGKVAKELIEIDATVEGVKQTYKRCKEWKVDFTPATLSKWYPQFSAEPAEEIPEGWKIFYTNIGLTPEEAIERYKRDKKTPEQLAEEEAEAKRISDSYLEAMLQERSKVQEEPVEEGY